MTPDELEHCIANATIALIDNPALAVPADRNGFESIARVANVPVGRVRSVLRGWGVQTTMGGNIGMTRAKREEIEALAQLPLTRPASIGSQNFSITTGDGSQVQAGHHVSGSQSMVTYQQVLESLKQQIEASPMPEEAKRSALQKLGEFMAFPGVVELLTLGANLWSR